MIGAEGTFTQYLGTVGTWAFLVAAWIFIGSMIVVAHRDGMRRLRRLVEPRCRLCHEPVTAKTEAAVVHAKCAGLEPPEYWTEEGAA